MNILLTGSSGFLARNLSILLSQDSLSKIYLSSRIKPLHTYANCVACEPFSQLTTEQLKGIDCIVHCASLGVNPHDRNSPECTIVNTHQTLRFFENSCHAGVKVIYSIGSMSEYGRNIERRALQPSSILLPESEYAKSKVQLCEKLTQSSSFSDSNLLIRHIRLFYFYGLFENHARLYPQIIYSGLKNMPLELTTATQVRDTSYSFDLALRILQLLREDFEMLPLSSPALVIQNDGSGYSPSVKEFVESVHRKHNFSNQLIFGARKTPTDESPYLVPDLSPSSRYSIAL